MTNPQHEALVEAVARALCGHVGGKDHRLWNSQARAAISALSVTAATPSDEVVRWASTEDPVGALAIRLAARAAALEEADGEWTWRDIARAALEPQAKDL